MALTMKTICWWSGGITSAVACKLALDIWECEIVFMDTKNEHPDTYRFKRDCEKWYGQEIKTISGIGGQYGSIEDVWKKYNSLNVATGAICSSELKREVRHDYQKTVEYERQVFGFEFTKREMNRALMLKKNHSDSKAVFPLLMYALEKKDCLAIVEEAGIKIPEAYLLGFSNNNCLGTGCIQGGIGYWQKMKREFPDKFNKMADMEHELTDKKGKPVTMLKDQGKAAKESGNQLVFLKKHPDYPELKCIDDMPQMNVEPLVDCNGFCGTNTLNGDIKTADQLNLSFE
jgi:3'-phosphoadenosine 5'-phosphosulfate sulfotransferase (PAPS reductase)/FAD synthetase